MRIIYLHITWIWRYSTFRVFKEAALNITKWTRKIPICPSELNRDVTDPFTMASITRTCSRPAVLNLLLQFSHFGH